MLEKLPFEPSSLLIELGVEKGEELDDVGKHRTARPQNRN